MATYKQIQNYVKTNYGYLPKSCWIAHVKELSGLKSRIAVNRISEDKRVCPCPLEKISDIQSAFRYFKML